MDKTLKKNILKGSASTSIGTILGMVFQFLTVILMTRFVSKDELGIYVLILVLVSMFNLLGGLGLELTMVRSIANATKDKKSDVIIPVLILRGLGSLFFIIIFLLTAKFILHLFDDRINNYVYLTIVLIVLSNYRELFYNLMQGLNQFTQYSIVNVTSSLFRFILILIYIFANKLNIENLIIIEILSNLQPLIHQIIVIPFKDLFKIKPNLMTYKNVIRFSIPLYLNNLVVFISGQANILIVAAYLSPSNIASYDVASKIPMSLKKIFQSFIIVYFPSLARLFSQNEKETAIILIKKAIGIFSVVMMITVLVSFIFKDEITIILYSNRYLESALTFAILILNFYLRGISDLIGYSFIPVGVPSVPVKVNFVASIISIGSSFILIPHYGYIGAAYALLFMNTVSIGIFYYYANKIGIAPGSREIIRPVLILLSAILIYYFIGYYSLIFGILYTIAFIFINWLFIDEFKYLGKFFYKYFFKIFSLKTS